MCYLIGYPKDILEDVRSGHSCVCGKWSLAFWNRIDMPVCLLCLYVRDYASVLNYSVGCIMYLAVLRSFMQEQNNINVTIQNI